MIRAMTFSVGGRVALVLGALCLVVADQWLKNWALQHLQVGQPPVPFVLGIEWFLTFNTGAAWSLMSGKAPLLAIGRLLVGTGLLAYAAAGQKVSAGMRLAFTLIAAGALGNAIDGLRLGHVVDMIHWSWLSQITNAINGTAFPIFNLADTYVVGGTLLLVLLSFIEKPEKKEHTQAGDQ